MGWASAQSMGIGIGIGNGIIHVYGAIRVRQETGQDRDLEKRHRQPIARRKGKDRNGWKEEDRDRDTRGVVKVFL